MSTIKNVVVTGATGSLGSVVLKTLLDTGKFNVRILKRAGSSSKTPAGIDTVEVDYSSVESLKAAVQGYDAVVSTVSTTAADDQYALIEASIAAGVKRLIPAGFGSNLSNANARTNPILGPRVQIEDHIAEKVKGTDTTYTFVYNGAFYDWGLQYNFILNLTDEKTPIIDGGNHPFSTTTLSDVAIAVSNIFLHPEETKNRAVFIRSTLTTQNKLLELAKKAAPEKKWQTVDLKLAELIATATEKISKGIFDMETVTPFLWRATWDPECGGNFDGSDNELLGVKGVTNEETIEIIKKILK